MDLGVVMTADLPAEAETAPVGATGATCVGEDLAVVGAGPNRPKVGIMEVIYVGKKLAPPPLPLPEGL